MDFTPVLVQTLKFEGGLRKTPTEYSNRGVEQKYYNEYAKANKLPVKDVKDLNFGEVKKFYQTEYWDKPKISSLNNEKVAGVLFDYAVNAGQGTAIKKLQEIVGSKPDGIIGPKTKKALAKYIEENGESALLQNILDTRAKHYSDIYMSDPQKYAGVINGWMNRVNALRQIYLNQ